MPIDTKKDLGAAPAPAFDLLTVRKQLDALRANYGADTPIGHRCSNLIEQLKNYERGTGDRWAIQQNMAKSLADLARLSSGPEHDADHHHTPQGE